MWAKCVIMCVGPSLESGVASPGYASSHSRLSNAERDLAYG